MKKIHFFILFIVFWINFFSTDAAILVLKHDEKNQKLVALTDQDKKNYLGDDKDAELKEPKTIFGTLHRYQWPSSTMFAASMREEEKRQLFSSTEGAEQKFIARKLKAIDQTYEAVHIPTTLYDLFVIHYILVERGAMGSFFKDYIDDYNPDPIFPILGLDVSLFKSVFCFAAENINNNFNSVFSLFSKANNAIKKFHFLINQAFGAYYLIKKAAYEKRKPVESFFSYMVADLLSSFIVDKDYYPEKIFSENERVPYFLLKEELLSRTAYPQINPQKTLAKALKKEEDAYRRNEALLFRGTKDFKIQSEVQNGFGFAKEDLVLIDSNLRGALMRDLIKCSKPRSLSYSNSILAGWFFDNGYPSGACTFAYFNKEAYGYVLTLSKQQYIKNNIEGLLSVAPLMTPTHLVSWGEFFHSRSKIALPNFCSGQDSFEGIWGKLEPLKDQSNYLFIIRDIFSHGRMLSKYISEKMQLMSLSENSLEQKIAVREKMFRDSQLQACQMYSGVKIGKRLVKKGPPSKILSKAQYSFEIDDIKQIKRAFCFGMKMWDVDFAKKSLIVLEKFIDRFWFDKSFIDMIKVKINELLKHENENEWVVFLSFINIFIKKNIYFKEILDVVVKGANSQYASVCLLALDLLSKLVERDEKEAFDEALIAAQKNIESDDEQVRISAIGLFKSLFSKGVGFKEVIALSQKCLNHDHDWVRITWFDLLSLIVKKGDFYSQVFEFAKKGLRDSFYRVRNQAFYILLQIAIATKSGVLEVRSQVWKFLKSLAAQSQFTDDLIVVIKRGLKANDVEVNYEALILCRELVKNGFALDTITRIITPLFSYSKNTFVLLGLSRNKIDIEVQEIFALIRKKQEEKARITTKKRKK